MNLSERVDEDLKTAMRERNATKLGVLRMLKAALTNATLSSGPVACSPDCSGAPGKMSMLFQSVTPNRCANAPRQFQINALARSIRPRVKRCRELVRFIIANAR